MTKHERFEAPRPSYKVNEAATMLRMGRAWLTQKAAAGDIPGAYRTNGTSGHWRFDPDKFDRYVADLRAGRIKERVQPAKKKQRSVKPKNVEMQDWLSDFRKAG